MRDLAQRPHRPARHALTDRLRPLTLRITHLDEKQAVAHLSSAVGYERRNVTTFIKRWAHERMRAESIPQFLLACLPQDRRLWRAGSDDKRMRKANRLVTELVTEQLGRAGSPLPAAMEEIVDYANERRENERLSTEEWQRLVDRGRGQIMERAVNGVYQMLRALPESELRVRTPMLEVMGMDYEQMALLAGRQAGGGSAQNAEDDLVSFGFRLRSYASRLQHHKDRAGAYHDLARQWEQAKKTDVAAEDSRPLYDFYRFEEDYHRRAMSKYLHLLPFLGDAGQWHEQQQQAAAYGQQLLSLMALRQDASLQRMKDAEQAEQLGRDIYRQPGGRHLTEGTAGRSVLDARIATMRRVYAERLDTLRADLAFSGLVLQVGPVGAGAPGADGVSADLVIAPGLAHDFDKTKWLDLHHLGYDFVADVEVGPKARASFTAAATERRLMLLAAMEYLDESGQSEAISDLPVDDVAAMVRVSRELTASAGGDGAGSPVLRSKIAELRAERGQAAQMRRSKASSLDSDLVVRVQAQVDAGVAGTDPTDAPEPGATGAAGGLQR
ncbi:relaxase MobL [Kitasatospora sp. NPDC098663]|uniref:relaxase MobL n=1 Tax=Kitasatospora sp. NPDC098663 TaxID=3364096 RepID=UPI00381D0FC7